MLTMVMTLCRPNVKGGQACDLAILRAKNPNLFNSNDSFAEERINPQTDLGKDLSYLSTLLKLIRTNEAPSYNLSLDLKVLKGLTGICSFASQYPLMDTAMKVTTNSILKRFFWGSACSVVSMDIIDNYLINQELKHKRLPESFFHCKCYWLSLAETSLFLQTSDMYIFYIHTKKSLFWSIFEGAIYSMVIFSLLNGIIQRSCKTNNLFTRYYYKGTNTCKILDIKEAFCDQLEGNIIKRFENLDSADLGRYPNLISPQNSVDQLAKNLFILAEIRKANKATPSSQEKSQLPQTPLLAIGLIAYLTNYYLDAILTKKSAAKMISDSALLVYFLVFASTVPNIYLDLQISSKALSDFANGKQSRVSNIYRSILQSYCDRKSVIKRIRHIFTLAMSIFGLGSIITVVKDNIGYKKHPLLSYGVLFFLADAISNFSSRSLNAINSWFENKNKKKQTLSCKIISLLADHIRQMSTDQFKAFVHKVDSSMLGDRIFSQKIKINVRPSVIVSDQADV